MTGVSYCTRADVKTAMDIHLTARADAQIDRIIQATSRTIEGELHRKFYPWTGTRYFDWPGETTSEPWRLWLDENELISLTSITSGGVTLSPADMLLYPTDGPPYTRLETSLATNATYQAGSTHQRAIAITGVFGHSAEETTAGALAEALDASETAIDVTNSAVIGVGDVIRVDNERMIVTGKQSLSTTAILFGSGETASKADTTIAIDNGTKINVGEVITVDSERMLVTDITGNNLSVVREWDGSVLASHANLSTLYAPRTLVVERGALGTTAAAHNTATAITKHQPPGTIHALAVAQSAFTLRQEQIGYGATTGGHNSTQRELFGGGLDRLWAQARASYGRKTRLAAV